MGCNDVKSGINYLNDSNVECYKRQIIFTRHQLVVRWDNSNLIQKLISSG